MYNYSFTHSLSLCAGHKTLRVLGYWEWSNLVGNLWLVCQGWTEYIVLFAEWQLPLIPKNT